MIRRRSLLAAAAAAGATPACALAEPPPALREVVVLGAREPAVVQGDATLARERHVACSTFKIPLTLIALQEGAVRDIDAPVPLDPRTFEPQPWWSEGMRADWGRPHSLRTAFAASAVWFYRRLALEIGAPRLAAYLAAFDYGDREMSAGLDNFWNAGERGIRISPIEQWRFLDRVARRALPLSTATYAQAREVFVREHRDTAVLRAKTGLGWRGAARASPLVGWFVGWTEGVDGQAQPFASLAVGGDAVIRARVDNATAALRAASAWR